LLNSSEQLLDLGRSEQLLQFLLRNGRSLGEGLVDGDLIVVLDVSVDGRRTVDRDPEPNMTGRDAERVGRPVGQPRSGDLLA